MEEKRALFIYDLPNSINEKFIRRTLFGEYSGIEKVDIMEKGINGMCSARVIFDSHDIASRVLKKMNYTKFDGFPIKIIWDNQETRDLLSSTNGKLIIKGLDERIEVSQLHEAFSNFGEVIICHIPMKFDNGSWESKCYGFIQFLHQKDADKACLDLKDASINDKKITLEPYFHEFDDLHICKSSENVNQLIIYDLPNSINEEFIRGTLFGEYSGIEKVDIMEKGINGMCSARVIFDSHDIASRVLKKMNYTKFDGFPIKIIWDNQETRDLLSSTNGKLIIKGLDENIEVSQLHEAFSNFGEVIICHIYNVLWKNQGCGFIHFLHQEDADKVCLDLKDASINDKKITLEPYFHEFDDLHICKSSESVNQLIIYDLPNSSNEEFIRGTLLGEYSGIEKVDIMKKGISGMRSARIIFDSFETASRVLQEMNYTKLGGIPIKIIWDNQATRDLLNSTNGKLIIKGLEESIEVSQLHETIVIYGEVIACIIPMRFENGLWKSKGYGFIQYLNQEDADRAFCELKYSSINDKKIIVEPFKKRINILDFLCMNCETKGQLIIYDLPKFANEEFIRGTLFGEYSGIEKVDIMKKGISGMRSARIIFDSFETASRVIQEVNYTKLDWIPIKIIWDDQKTRDLLSSTSGKLIIKGLEESIEASQLHDVFSSFGEIIICHIPMKFDNRLWKNQGYGFIQFLHQEDADKACLDLKDASINDKKITLEPYFHEFDDFHMRHNKFFRI